MVGQWTFRIVDVLVGPVTTLIIELQRQIDSGGAFDTRLLLSVALGAVLQILWHVSRTRTEDAERTAEVVTGVSQDADPEVEQPPTGGR